jgi:hypothetical protein
MIRAGHADVLVIEGRPFARLRTYEAATAEASGAGRGVWGACVGDFHRPGPPDDTAIESRSESAERFVRRYYFLINERRFSVAWTKLSARLRGQLGPQSRWRSGFRRTLGTRVNSAKRVARGWASHRQRADSFARSRRVQRPGGAPVLPRALGARSARRLVGRDESRAQQGRRRGAAPAAV